MKKISSMLLVLVLTGLALFGCAPRQTTAEQVPIAEKSSAQEQQDPSKTPEKAEENPEEPYKVGVILLGDENDAYSYSHIEGIEQAKATLGLTDAQIVYQYNIPEDQTCYDAAINLVEQGCSLIFANSFSHESFMLQAAQENPDVIFAQSSGLMAANSGIDNFVNYFTHIYEAQYVSGVVAGMKLQEQLDAGEITDAYIGYVGAYPYAEVVSSYTAFLLGARSIVPDAHMDVIYTNSWHDITAESEAANLLMARGAVMLNQFSDSAGVPTAVETAHANGAPVHSCSYNVDMREVAPHTALVTAKNVWGVQYTNLIGIGMAGEDFDTDYAYGFEKGGVELTPLGVAVAEGTQQVVDTVIADIQAGKLHVFDCDTFTVNEEHLTSYDQSFGYEGNELIWDGYFHESALRAGPAFDLRMDGITELMDH